MRLIGEPVTTSTKCLYIVNLMWNILSNEIADQPDDEVIRDIKAAIPRLQGYLITLKKLTE
jgi:hypothetical protein